MLGMSETSVTNLARQGARDSKQSDSLKVIEKSKILNATVETLAFLYSIRLGFNYIVNLISHINSVIW